MSLSVKVSSKHQIAVPAAVRRQLAIHAGDRLRVQVLDGVIMLIPESADPIEQLKGLGADIWAGVDIQEYINRERDGW